MVSFIAGTWHVEIENGAGGTASAVVVEDRQAVLYSNFSDPLILLCHVLDSLAFDGAVFWVELSEKENAQNKAGSCVMCALACPFVQDTCIILQHGLVHVTAPNAKLAQSLVDGLDTG